MNNLIIWIYAIIAFIVYWYYKSNFFMIDNSDVKGNALSNMSFMVVIEVLAILLGALWPLSLLTWGLGRHDI